MIWVHRVFAIAAALPLLAWVVAMIGAWYLQGADTPSDLSMLFGFYATWGSLILLPASGLVLVIWGVVALALKVRRAR